MPRFFDGDGEFGLSHKISRRGSQTISKAGLGALELAKGERETHNAKRATKQATNT